MLRKWIIALAAVLTFGVGGANLTSLNAQTPKPGAMASPAGKMAKKMPARDAKGRFVKAAATPAPTKKMPARDAKGRFVKSTAATPAPTKKMPARDAKGRFIKTTPTPAPPK